MNLYENWGLEVDRSVFKALKRVSRYDAERILEIIKILPANPYFGDVQKMKGEENSWRRRIGAFRIFYKIKSVEKVILVFHLERRTSKTY
ncbi:hypothetical protein A3G55_03795 [Candidatus Giovannonibacteria bacterium RIFCSPLOWO2_12_FULL_44_25]|uniref:Plasmid stabilization protein n=2 Tax=Candidatus Giovannoniibacteriota TaxID=1752738 RepID=A0A1F5W9T1_9BACT|nr:MAG: hypothetical protein UW15_C0026G0018 [Parcubacteria group bacterium GW2011_GWC1_44_10]KKT60362.1 MAG: hypothetical protein UW53_C0001G0012 [Candidatus Giovannonibacteria bacterium GW2011_GWA1_44_25]KKU29438.1 MAG: hypothetical protein UX43_C0013G0009 [Candidatus Giovannonibacteria bacterium GW2011_GWB1_46_20]OGF50431.1 MAG: hypothetical protein A2120_02180 [Candidatus Giovannonibacteria bacterium GWA2_45_15]OGF59135.1 MAG: hypothetical protein A2W40_02350 [Candidatus Giovannonibacteria 